MKKWMSCFGAAALAVPVACAHSDVGEQREALAKWRIAPAGLEALEPPGPTEEDVGEVSRLEGALNRFVAHALRRSPELRAAHARWASAVHEAAAAGRLPEPQVGYGGFIEAVETRVGPQQHRISLQQAVPWPGRLDAASDARVAAAAAEGHAFRARVLDLVREIAGAYWQLWRVERSHAIRLDHERLLEGLVGTIRARVETGEKPIAELLQVQLRLQALRDHRTEHRSQMRQLQAQLLASIGADPGVELQTTSTEPPVELPKETLSSLRGHARQNPLVTRWTELASVRLADARAARAGRLPDFRVGADYIVTGEARMDGLEDSGKDPIIVSFGVTVPIWLNAYASEVRAAEAGAAAARAAQQGAWLRVAAELESVVARLRETYERIRLYEGTLLPQTDALHASVSAAYEVGRSGVSEILLALEDELELRLELARVRTEHALAWAELERLTGRTLEAADRETES